MALELVNRLPYDHPYRWDGTLFGGPKLWRPDELGADLALWLDAEDTASITLNGSNVSQWDDKSGNNNHVSQGSASAQPAYTAGLVTFDGSNDALIAATPIITATDTGTLTMFSVSSLVAGESGYMYGAVDPGQGCALYQSNGTNIGFARTATGATAGQVAHNITLPGQGVIGVVFSTDTANLSFNGTVTSVVGGLAFTAPTVEFTLGNRRNGTSVATFWEGGHREIVVSNAALTTADRQKLEGYLAWKWGLEASLPVDHPYKTTPPTV
jgi:hypothetical protein